MSGFGGTMPSPVGEVEGRCGVVVTPRRTVTKGPAMPKMRKKSDLPEKICPACGRPFSWRKKWEKVWDQVRYCSERCKKVKIRVD